MGYHNNFQVNNLSFVDGHCEMVNVFTWGEGTGVGDMRAIVFKSLHASCTPNMP